MGLYSIPCRQCGEIFLWFSGNLDQRCGKCVGAAPPYMPPPIPQASDEPTNQAVIPNVAQGHPERFAAMQRWATENNLDPSALDTQLQYINVEARTSPELMTLFNSN